MKEYVVNINGIDHTMLLDEDDAKRYGDAAKPGTAAAAAKARSAEAAQNKARGAQNK